MSFELIELGGLLSKAGLDRIANGDRALLLGALLVVAERLKCDDTGEVRARWRRRGDQAFNQHAAANTKP